MQSQKIQIITEMKEQNEEKNLEIGEVISNTEMFIEKNQKALIWGIVAVLVVVLAVFGARKFYFQPRQVEAAEMMFAAENLFANGEYEKALNGSDNEMGFLEVAKSYKCTKCGKMAAYYAGICQLNMGEYDAAVKSFKSYKGKDTFTKVQCAVLLGDAYLELGDASAAINNYEKAVKMDPDNYLTAPNALLKAGLTYLGQGNNEKAVACFKKIKENYPQSTERAEVDKYAAFAGDIL